MKILFVGGGRRVGLAKAFLERGIQVVGWELNPKETPLTTVCPVVQGLGWNTERLAMQNHLNRVMETWNIDFLLPLQDEAIGIVAQSYLPRICSSIETAQTCFDKFQFHQFCAEHFWKHLPLKSEGYPRILKPRFGFGSNGIHKVHTWEEEDTLREHTAQNTTQLIYRWIDGDEYTVDIYRTKDKNIISVSPRLRERVAGGEVVNSTVVWDEDIAWLAGEVADKLDIIGPACVQIIKEKETGHLYLIECNARFGGGSVLSIEAGMDMPSMIEAEYSSGPTTFMNSRIFMDRYDNWKPGLKMRRYFSEVYI